jgi:hypothetical protein
MPLFSLVSAGGIGKATVNATTGSPTTNNNARAGKTVYQFNGSGTINVGTAGTAEILVVGGGGGGSGWTSQGGGGAGGVLYDASAFLPTGTLTVTVGGGGNSGSGNPPGALSGYSSRLGNYYSVCGGSTGNATSDGGTPQRNPGQNCG